jgi:acetyl-CoA carboxylase carboxyl transferase subunit alpha
MLLMSNNLIVERERGLVELERRIEELRQASAGQPLDMASEIGALEQKYQEILQEMFGTLSPWEKVHMARHPNRPTSLDYISRFDRFDELHGDRHFRDDPSIVGGFARLRARDIMVLGQQRGRDTKENLRRNFGMPAPEGYRKATRLTKLASRLRLPVVTFVDTKGADPGISSEEHAQSEAIAICLQAFMTATVPIVAAVIGEGGSGGALALAIADYVIMLEHSTYSVASPEGCAAILWSDASKAEEAAARLKLTADDLHRFGIVDEILPEPLGGAHRNANEVVTRTLDTVAATLARLTAMTPATLMEQRYRKYRRLGEWQAKAQEPVSTAR